MARQRKLHDAGFKARVSLEAVKERDTVSVLAKRFSVHPTQVHQWKRRLLDGAASVFETPGSEPRREETASQAELYEQIGRLKVELEWVKKKAAAFGG
jgi:putative transposase